jgi:hypothetical protein
MQVVVITSLAVFGWSRSVVAQTESPRRTILVYVTALDSHVSLSPSEHLLVFQNPIEIPGAVLPAGAYIFRLPTPSIVQVISANRFKVYASFMTIADQGIGDTGRERVKFELDQESERPRMVGWYLADGTGHEFLYPKKKEGRVDREIER